MFSLTFKTSLQAAATQGFLVIQSPDGQSGTEGCDNNTFKPTYSTRDSRSNDDRKAGDIEIVIAENPDEIAGNK
ncbi:hypothetical protein [Pseudomonas sp. S2_H01]